MIDPTSDDVSRRLRRIEAAGGLHLPLPGRGHTPERLAALMDLGADDLSVARLAEAHTDATAIFAEAGREPPAGQLYGVWAAGGPSNRVVAERAAGGWRLRGTRHYCSGATILDRALLPVDAGSDQLLVDVDVRHPQVIVDVSDWRTPTMHATATATVRFDGVPVGDDAVLGGPSFYLDRPGFWIGSVGVAAVWAGGAIAVAETLRSRVADEPHALAHLGAVDALVWATRSMLMAAAAEIDRDPCAPPATAMARALRVRHLVERAATEIIDRSARALGPEPLVRDAAHARRVAELQLYVRQTHADRDLEALGRLVGGAEASGR